MERLIRDLLDATQLEAGRPLELQREPADLVTLASRCVGAYEKVSAAHRLRLLVGAPTAPGFWDVSRLERVVGNLLANAIKYSPAGGDVVVSVDVDVSELARNVVRYATGGRGEARLRRLEELGRVGLEVAVCDDGPGIANVPEAMQAGFTSGTGLGMGLPGARRLMDHMEIDSALGRGTTIVVRKWRR